VRLCGHTHVRTAIAAVQVDHAARVQRAGLRRHRNRLVLNRGPLALVDHGAQPVAAAQRLLVDQARLGLAHGFTRVELGCRGIRALRRGVELRAAQAQRVIGARIHMVGHQRELPAVGQLPVKARIGQVALRRAMRPEAVAAKAAGVQGIAQ
jgi:hypothetical protein